MTADHPWLAELIIAGAVALFFAVWWILIVTEDRPASDARTWRERRLYFPISGFIRTLSGITFLIGMVFPIIKAPGWFAQSWAHHDWIGVVFAGGFFGLCAVALAVRALKAFRPGRAHHQTERAI